jgi:hypothetical protein
MNFRERERERAACIASNLPAYANKKRGERALILGVYVCVCVRARERERERESFRRAPSNLCC